MTVGVDVDDVVTDFVNPLLEFVNKTRSTRFSYEQVYCYNLWEVWGCTRDESIEIVRDFYRSPQFDSLPIIPGTAEALKTIAQKHTLTFITSRFAEAIPKTPIWFDRYCSLPKPRIIYCGEYQSGRDVAKADICLQEGIDCIIEDNAKYALECAQKGIKTILFNRPWNQNIEHENIHRVKKWAEALELI